MGRYIQYYENKKSKGLCPHCGNKSEENRIVCQSCQLKHNERIRNMRNRRIEEGLCPRCGLRPTSENRRHCSECAKRRSETIKIRIKRLISEGICPVCGQRSPIDGKQYCELCLSKRSERDKKIKFNVINEYGGKCTCCGEDNPSFLSIDHINSNGRERRKNELYEAKIYRWLTKHNFTKDNYQLLCFNCNMGKHFNGGVCPHKVISTGG